MNVLDFIETRLLTCLCEKLAAAGRPVCACHHFGGEEPPVGDRCSKNDAGQNGQAWVRRVGSQLVAEADEITFEGAPCGAGANWSSQIELGVYRCISAVPDENGGAPPPENYDADRELLAADRASLAEVLCCWPLAGTAPPDFEFDLGGIAITRAEITPTGPSGSCAGSILTVTVSSSLLATELEEEQMFISRPAGAL